MPGIDKGERDEKSERKHKIYKASTARYVGE
jgi:hypothetical protein